MGVITRTDCHDMLRFGISAARDGSDTAIESAAEYMLLAVGPYERRFLRFEFHEGVRNYARDQQDVYRIMNLLDTAIKTLKAKQ